MPGNEKTFVVYILTNTRRGVPYVGATSDLFARVHQHRTGALPGFTDRYGLRRLVWFGDAVVDATEAFAFEKRLKRWRRPWKFELIEKMNPEWADLAEDWFPPSGGGGPGDPGSPLRSGRDDDLV